MLYNLTWYDFKNFKIATIELEYSLRLKIMRNDWLLASASSQSLCVILSLRMNSSFITSKPERFSTSRYSCRLQPRFSSSRHMLCIRGSRKFCQRGSNFFLLFVYEGREDPNITINEPSSARHLNGVSLACRFMAQH